MATTLKELFNKVIDESLKGALAQKALDEKEKQASTAQAGDLDALSGDQGQATPQKPADASKGGSGAPTSSKTMDSDTDAETMKKGDIKADDVIEKLNSIRSGRSFKDSGVSGPMEQYVESLSSAEKTALFAFLKGIAQIVTGEVPAKAATEPDSNPANVQMQKKDATQHKVVKPNVIKADQPGPSGSAKNVEDTSSPISVKKR